MDAKTIVEVIAATMDAIEAAAREAGPMGAPSGVVYAALSSQGMTLKVYQQMLSAMEAAGRIKVENHLIHVVEKEAQGA